MGSKCWRCLLVSALFQVPLFAADPPWKANPELVKQRMAQTDAFNYRESAVPQYSLPDPLVHSSDQVVTAESWPERRAELLNLFRDHVYGRRPEVDPEIDFEVRERRGAISANIAEARHLEVVITRDDGADYRFDLYVFFPARAAGLRVPAVVHLNNRDFPTFKQAVTESSEFWPVEMICGRGFVAAAISTKQVDPDAAGRFADGIRGFLANGPQETEAPNAWRALSAWGWGVSRAVDYLQGLPEVDPQQIAVVGHSRGGKAALWAAAEDPRIAIAYSNESGCGGAALSRRAYGETVARITQVFPHWFCERFSEYAGRESELPVDQHQLIALIAPRAVYVASADEDLWADPKGEYGSLVAAAPVFELLGVDAIRNPEMPPLGKPRVAGKTGYHIRAGKHNLTPRDWNDFLSFAQQQFSADAE